jgi:hypothetical protein
MKIVLVFGGAPITVGYWSITGPAGEGTLTPFSLDPANAELVAAFLAKNYNTNDGFAAKRTNTRLSGRAFLFGVDLRSLVVVAPVYDILAVLTP